jgi:hypothetical protein
LERRIVDQQEPYDLTTRIRIAFALIVIALTAGIAGCGGSSSNGEDPSQVLSETFNNDTKVSSAHISLNLSGNVEGSQSGSFTASLDGAFQSDPNDDTAFPQLDLQAKVGGSAAGQTLSFDGGVTATQDAAFVTYKGQAYQVPSATFESLKQTYQQQAQAAQSQSQGSSASSILSDLGIDPSTWLTNESNEGTTDVGGTSTIHIHGDADVSKILADFAKAAQNVPGASTQGFDPSQLSQVSQFVNSATVDVYSGQDDHLLRKLEINLDISPPASASSAGVTGVTIDFSIELSDVNQPQTITAPSGAKPFSDLAQQLGGLGIPGLGSSSIPGLGGSGGGSLGPSKSAQAQYTKCVLQAGTNASKANDCLKLLQ